MRVCEEVSQIFLQKLCVRALGMVSPWENALPELRPCFAPPHTGPLFW